jgi:hypothetical protein
MTIAAGSTILASDLTKDVVNATHAGMTLASGLNAVTWTETVDEGSDFAINKYFPPSGRAVLIVVRILFPNPDTDGGSLTGSEIQLYNVTTLTVLRTLIIDTAISQAYERGFACIYRAGTSEELSIRINNKVGATRHTTSGYFEAITL